MRFTRAQKIVSAIFLACIAWYAWIVATNEKPFRPESPWETSSRTVEAKMDGVTFHIPGNYLGTFLQLSKERPDELVHGFIVNALMPDFLPFSLERRDDFLVVGQDSKMVYIHIYRPCALDTENDVNSKNCTVDASLGAAFKTYTFPRVSEDGLAGFVPADIPGMTFIGVRASTAIKEKGKPLSDVYVAKDEAGRRILLFCNLPGTVPNPLCQLKYAWGGKFMISIVLERSMRKDWGQVKAKTDAFFTSISTEAQAG